MYKRMFSVFLTLCIMCGISTAAFAEEIKQDTNRSTSVEMYSTEENSTDDVLSIQPRGVLSGYGNGTTNHTDTYYPHDGEFWFDVEGSWSPYAGCTIKTEGFANDDAVIVKVYDEDGEECLELDIPYIYITVMFLYVF